jgi:hypothetical protein
VTDTEAVTAAVLGPPLFVVCAAMAATSAVVYRLAGLGTSGSIWQVSARGVERLNNRQGSRDSQAMALLGYGPGQPQTLRPKPVDDAACVSSSGLSPRLSPTTSSSFRAIEQAAVAE